MNLLQARWVGLDVHTDTVSVEGMIPFGPFVRNDAEFSAVQDVCACVRVLCVFLCVQAVCTLYRARVTLKPPLQCSSRWGMQCDCYRKQPHKLQLIFAICHPGTHLLIYSLDVNDGRVCVHAHNPPAGRTRTRTRTRAHRMVLSRMMVAFTAAVRATQRHL